MSFPAEGLGLGFAAMTVDLNEASRERRIQSYGQFALSSIRANTRPRIFVMLIKIFRNQMPSFTGFLRNLSSPHDVRKSILRRNIKDGMMSPSRRKYVCLC